MMCSLATFKRDVRMGLRHPGQFLMVPVFFVLAVVLFPLALGPDPAILKTAAPGLLTVAALFAALLPLDRLFAEDKNDGTLDVLAAAPVPLVFYAAGKIAAHWFMTGLPLVVIAPFLAVMLGLSEHLFVVAGALLPATLLLGLTGSIGAALTLGTRQGNVLLALLIVPLYIPVLIFCAGAIDFSQSGGSYESPLLLLWAMLAVALPVAPLVTGSILSFQVR